MKNGRLRGEPPVASTGVPGDQFIALATLLNTFDTLEPTVCMAMMAATEISEAMSTYSMAVAPCSFFIRRRKMDSISISKNRRCSIKLWSAAPAGFWGSEGVEDKTTGTTCQYL